MLQYKIANSNYVVRNFYARYIYLLKYKVANSKYAVRNLIVCEPKYIYYRSGANTKYVVRNFHARYI